MSSTGKQVHVLRKSPVQQNGTSSHGGKVSKNPQSKGTKSKIVLAPMNGGQERQEDFKSSGMRGRSSSFGKEEMNLIAVRKVDTSVTNILSTVAQVKLYQYDQKLNEWERTSTEGTLFIYSRTVGHGFMILNRLNNDNLLEEVLPNMVFRVQSPFVLFKKSPGNILGLCFQEESSCQETGELLNSLSGQENLLPLNGHHSPYSRRNPSLNPSMRSTSAPAFKQHASTTGKPPFLVDVLENYSYTSSEGDNTSSPDSLTSDPISFLAATTTTSASASTTSSAHYGKKGHKSAGTTKEPSSTGSVSPRNQSKSSGKNSVRTTSPRDIPHGSKVKGKSQQGQTSSGSVSPVKGRSRSPKQHQQGKKQNGGTVDLSSSVGGPGPRIRGGGGGGMRHAVSFDQGFVSPHRSITAPQPTDYHQLQSSTPFDLLAAKVSGQPPPLREQLQMDKTVRRLFSPDMSVQPAKGGVAVTMGTLSESVPNSLHTIFAQVSSADSTTPLTSSAGGESGVLPLKVISLEQVEKQMVEDVPSPPVSLNPLSIFSSTSAQSSSSSSGSNALPSSSSQQLLLRPSAFMSSTHTPTVTSTQLISTQSSTTTTTTTGGNQQGLPPSHSPLGGTNSPPAVSVEPPSPIVNLAPLFANVSGTTPSLSATTKAPHFPGKSAATDQSFPAIPPLMHSPGMRAAPVPRHASTSQQLPSLRGEPSSLVTTTTSAHIQLSSSTPTKLSQVEAAAKTGGKLSQQVSSTKEPVAQVPPTTPQKQSSQSTPSLTPLAELSVPRRSTTAPAGPSGVGGALMSPHQFAHSTTTTGVDDDQTSVAEERSTVRRRGAEPVGLTREQLQRAMLYLIKHDDGFVTKLHEAYNLSLSENSS